MKKFWNKIFGKKSVEKSNAPFDQYRLELEKLGYQTVEDLELLVKPLIKKATKIGLNQPSRPPYNSQLISHFGGQPYFEKAESWPKSKSGKSMDFIFQIYNEEGIEMPKEIALIQLFYDWDEFPWDTKNDGWKVKIYGQINPDQMKLIEKPYELDQSKYCELTFKSVESLPDWEGIDLFSDTASKLSCVLIENQPWASYDKIVSHLIGEQDCQSQLGGYPKWIQGESTPMNNNGEPMKLLFQIDSEDNADIMWGDSGLIYVFYDVVSKRTEFNLQCY